MADYRTFLGSEVHVEAPEARRPRFITRLVAAGASGPVSNDSMGCDSPDRRRSILRLRRKLRTRG
jgi:hypothetical protein